MPFHSDLDQLIVIAEEAEAENEWRDLASYFRSRGSGLRKEALATLNSFLAEAVEWSFNDRLRLTRWIAFQRASFFDYRLLLPQPLLTRFVSPTLFEWVGEEPTNAQAHFLTAIVAVHDSESAFEHKPFHLRRTLMLDPTHDDARVALVDWLTSEAEYNQHELPWYYLGDAKADLEELREAEDVACGIVDPLRRESKRAKVNHLRKIASTWLAFRQSGHADFSDWCNQHGVDICSNI